jgi:hypothetical protein
MYDLMTALYASFRWEAFAALLLRSKAGQFLEVFVHDSTSMRCR